MPKTLADGKRKIVFLSARPADVDAITTTEAAAGTDASDYVLTTSTINQPSGSDTIAEKVWSSSGNAEAFGPSNFSGNELIIHRYFDAADGQPDDTDDATWASYKTKGTTLRALTRVAGLDSATAFGTGDEYRYGEYTTDDPIDESGDGYIKFRIPLAYAGVSSLDNVIAAGA